MARVEKRGHGPDATPRPRVGLPRDDRGIGAVDARDPVLARALRVVHGRVGGDQQLVGRVPVARIATPRRWKVTGRRSDSGTTGLRSATPSRIFSART